MQIRALLLLAGAMGAMASVSLPQKVYNKAIALEEDTDNSGDATEEDVEGEEPVCHTYKNENARLELCEVELDEYMSDGKRVAKTHLYLTNVGEVGVCNVTFWIEGVHTEDLVEYWPEWIYLKNNEGYFDPKEGLDLGGNVNLDEGWPLYYLGNGFHECLPPDYAGEDFEPCTTIEKDHVNLEWCVNEHYKSWTEGDGTRMIEAQGTLTNKGPASICGLTFALDRLENATNTWPDWFPSLDEESLEEPFREGDVLTCGGNVPAKGGRPDLILKSYKMCPDQTFDDDTTSDSSEEKVEEKKKPPPKRLQRPEDDEDEPATSPKVKTPPARRSIRRA